ncbi:MAG TPA: SMP-30/gluconolactonase/LRE family protein, partial [Herpetosiphonaceae bacterium]
ADGNLWFTESDIESPNLFTHNIGRITPGGEITEFPVCLSCYPNDIVQGPNGVLYFTQSNSALGRITTAGEALADLLTPRTNVIGNNITAAGDDVWFTDFNNHSVWRYNVPSDQFTEFAVPTPAATPYDVAVAPDGSVWFSELSASAIGRLDPASGIITEMPVTGSPRHIALTADGSVWYTDRFGHAIGRLVPATSQVTVFPLLTPGAGPEDIAATADGNLWFTQFNAGNIARITPAGVITEGKRANDSGPFGIAIGPGQSVWYAQMRANKIAVLSP